MIALYTSLCWLLNIAPEGDDPLRPAIHASDVVFMYPASDPVQYEAYGGTVAGWAGRPRQRDEHSIRTFQERVDQAQTHGMRYCGSVDFLVDFGGFIDFCPDRFLEAVTRDLDGNPLRVPWLWDHQHKGNPSYWFCTNHPDYQAYLRDQVERVCTAPVDGLHIDDYSGSSASSAYNGGCFCDYCMAGFRQYLKDEFSEQVLEQMGVMNTEEFNYAVFLRAQGVTAEQFRRESQRCPLGNLFQDFQNRQMKRVVGQMFEYAEQLRGRRLLRSVNSSASSPRTLVVSPLLDYFCGEVPHHASSQTVPLEPVFVFRLVEGVHKRQTATGAGQDWAWIKAHEKPGLVRTWIAQAYAFGSVFMVPHRQWCYTQELGTHWWYGQASDLAFVYGFVREHQELLDGYVSLAEVALIYANSNFGEIRDAALKLAEANVPYTILVAGDENLPSRVTPAQLDDFPYLITGSNSLADGQEETLSRSGGQVIRWQGIESLPPTVTDMVSTGGDTHVRVSLRHRPDSPTSARVCHVLNLDYDPEADDVRPGNVSLSLDLDVIGQAVDLVSVHRPNDETEELNFTTANGRLEVTLARLGLWALVTIQAR